MADTLILHEIAVECRLGVEEWEQTTPQPVWIDLEVGIDAARAAVHDDVGEAVDYAKLVAGVRGLAERTSYRLLETLAEAIASSILKESGSTRVKVRVKKKAMPGVGYAAVEVERRVARPGVRESVAGARPEARVDVPDAVRGAGR